MKLNKRNITNQSTKALGEDTDGKDIAVGKNHGLCDVVFTLAGIQEPKKLSLNVAVVSDNAPRAENKWDFWVNA